MIKAKWKNKTEIERFEIPQDEFVSLLGVEGRVTHTFAHNSHVVIEVTRTEKGK